MGMRKNILKICPICKKEVLMSKKQQFCGMQCSAKNNKTNNSPWRRGFV